MSELDFTSGKELWAWNALDRLKEYDGASYVGYTPERSPNRAQRNMYVEFFEGNPLNPGWTHVNSAQRLPNGNTILSLRNFDLVVEVDPQGNVVWSYGALVLKHQHCAWVLDNGHLLIADNGNARIIEVDRATQRIVWEYRGGLKFATQGCAYRLPNGDTLINGLRQSAHCGSDTGLAGDLGAQGTSARDDPPLPSLVESLKGSQGTQCVEITRDR